MNRSRLTSRRDGRRAWALWDIRLQRKQKQPKRISHTHLEVFQYGSTKLLRQKWVKILFVARRPRLPPFWSTSACCMMVWTSHIRHQPKILTMLTGSPVQFIALGTLRRNYMGEKIGVNCRGLQERLLWALYTYNTQFQCVTCCFWSLFVKATSQESSYLFICLSRTGLTAS